MTDLFFSTPIRSQTGDWLDTLNDWLTERRRRSDRRRELRDARAAFVAMTLRDDRLLDDMGLTRDDVDWAKRLPLEVNAARAARNRARRRRAGD